jgi:DNA-binding IclR family transcriptional regulator
MTVGSRVPTAYTAMGRAFLAALTPAQREPYYDLIQAKHAEDWPLIQRNLQSAYADYASYGFCMIEREWNRDISGVGVPMLLENGNRVVVFSCGGSALRLTHRIMAESLGPRLRAMVAQVRQLVEGTDE